MKDRQISDDRLVALADGELSTADAATLHGRIGADPELAERYALFVETRALLTPIYKVAQERDADDGGLDRLASAIRTADAARSSPPGRPPFTVVEGGADAAARREEAVAPRRIIQPWFRAPALAASLALAVGGVLGYAAGHRGAAGDPGGGIAAVAGAPGAEIALASALERSGSGERLAWSDAATNLKGAVSVISTHRLKDGRICREHETSVDGQADRAVGLSCRGTNGRWRTEIVARNAESGSDYGTASGANMVENALEGMGSEGAASAAEERRLLSSGWIKATP